MKITDRKPTDIISIHIDHGMCMITIQHTHRTPVEVELERKEVIRLIEVLNEVLEKI